MYNQRGLRNLNLRKVRILDRLAMRNPDLASQLRNVKLDWYSIRNQVDEETQAEVAEVFIYDEIGGSWGVQVMDLVNDLNALDADEIVVRINSPGGMLIDGITIGNALAQHPARIVTRVDGIAASAASVIAVYGDVVEMGIGSQMMIHDALCPVEGNPRDLRDAADWLDEQSANVAEIYAQLRGGSAEEWRSRMQAETWMFASEALELKMADRMHERSKPAIGSPGPSMPVLDDELEELESAESSEPEAEVTQAEVLENLMNRKHRLSNRGYKFLGRDKAPSPVTNTNGFVDMLEAWR